MPLIMGRAPGNNKPLFGNTQISWTQFGELQVIRDVPNISLNIGQTHSMTQYMLDPGNLRVSTAVLENGVPLSGATLNIISYDSGTELLTAVGPGTVGQLQLQVTY